MKVKRFSADSFLEAFLHAQMELGEDMIVVTSQLVVQNSWAGMFKKEMWEITAMAGKSTGSRPPAINTAPSRPVEAEEIYPQRPPMLIAEPMTTGIRHNSPPPPAASTRERGITHPGQVDGQELKQIRGNTYRPPSGGLRGIHTIRSNQIGDHEPQSQREQGDEASSRRLQSILEDIIKKRREDDPPGAVPSVASRSSDRSGESSPVPALQPMSRGSSASPASEVCPAEILKTVLAQSGGEENSQIKTEIEKKFSEILQMLGRLQDKSTQVLSTPSAALPEGLRWLKERLIRQETPEDLVDEIIEDIRGDLPLHSLRNPTLVRQSCARILDSRIQFSPLPAQNEESGPMIVILMGPTGVGKTTTIAKLAASFALDVVARKSVALFTLDTYRIGAPTQLSQYAQIIEAEMEIIYEEAEIQPALERHQKKDIILVDTAGRSQKNHKELKEMKPLLACFPNARKFLVLSATTKFSDMVENENRFGELGYDRFIFTKTDETSSIGSLLALLYRSKAPVAYLTHGQSVPDDFRPASFDFFQNRLFDDLR